MEEKLICFDLDGTLAKGQSWEQLNVALGMSVERDWELYKAYLDGAFDYDGWMERIVADYVRTERPHREIITDLYSSLELLPGATEAVVAAKERGYRVALISGSYVPYVEAAAQALGIGDWHACTEIIYDEDGYVSRYKHSDDEGAAKLTYLTAVAEKHGLALTECICVADGPNDEAMFTATKKGITFPESPVKDIAWKVIDSIDELPVVI